MTREEAMQNIQGILDEATEEEDSVCYVTSYDAEALQMAIEALKGWECKCCAYWDKLDYDAPRRGWCNQFEEWTDADEFCSRCARMRGEEE